MRTNIGHREWPLPTYTFIYKQTQTKRNPGTTGKTRNYDRSYPYRRYTHQASHTFTGDYTPQEYPASEYKYAQRHRRYIGHQSFPKVCGYAITNSGWHSHKSAKALSTIGQKSQEDRGRDQN